MRVSLAAVVRLVDHISVIGTPTYQTRGEMAESTTVRSGKW